ncbi:hypothetical protein [Bradyrhizobium paxllaeri]|uniref:hypothetical protein n=1 Tax=Bradyrhizobium paxllaeri TaxID=190148 RepID=UPI000810DFB2|nr:hypothetical protein [Bradyrhizobium paxllaeri]
MTLIVGMANAEIGFLVGDTLLTPLLEVKGNPAGVVNGEFHGLKIQILNDQVAIAFSSSNAVDIALNIIAEVWRKLQSNSQTDICVELLEHYQKNLESSGNEKPDCEFLVLQLDEKGNQLVHVTAEGIRPCERCYIGDQAQYKQLNALRKPYLPTEAYVQQPDGSFKVEKANDSKGQIEFMEISLALEELVQQRNKAVGAIGGNVIRVRDAWPSGNLEYMQIGMASLSPEEGQSGYSLLSSSTGTRGVGIYYKSGKLGFLMIVGDAETCRKETAETIQSFIELAAKEYGMNLVGPT